MCNKRCAGLIVIHLCDRQQHTLLLQIEIYAMKDTLGKSELKFHNCENTQ